MFRTARAPALLGKGLPAPIAPRGSRPSGRKNAHRGLTACRTSASAQKRPQALAASGENCRRATISRWTSLLPQTQPTLVPGVACAKADICNQDNASMGTAAAQTALVGAVVVAPVLAILGAAELGPASVAALVLQFGPDAVIPVEVGAGIQGAEALEQISDASFALDEMNETTQQIINSLSKIANPTLSTNF